MRSKILIFSWFFGRDLKSYLYHWKLSPWPKSVIEIKESLDLQKFDDLENSQFRSSKSFELINLFKTSPRSKTRLLLTLYQKLLKPRLRQYIIAIGLSYHIFLILTLQIACTLSLQRSQRHPRKSKKALANGHFLPFSSFRSTLSNPYFT